MPLDDFAGVPADNNDGSLSHAALAMPDFDGMDDPSPTQTTEIIDPREANRRRAPVAEAPQPRAADGKFAEAARSNLPPEAADQDDHAPDGAVDASAPDEEWFELPAEREGEAPKRIKAEDVWKGYQEREQLLAHVEQMSRIMPPPPQYDEEIYRTVQVRGRMIQELQTLIQANQPMEPDLSLIDDNSPRYNPGEYQRQVALQRDMVRRHQQLQARQHQEQQQISQEQEALTAARRAREQSKLVQFWPEIRDPVVQRQVRDDAAKYFGIDDEVLNTVMDVRFYAVLRHALNDINGQRQRQNTVKVVRAKPKLVRGAARDSTGPKTAQYSTGMRNLQRSGSIDDAADAIGALF